MFKESNDSIIFDIHRLFQKNDKWIITPQKGNLPSAFQNKSNWSVLRISSAERCRPFASPALEDLSLTAIKNGARYIYLPSNLNNGTTSILNRLFYDKYMTSLRYNGVLKFPLFSYLHDLSETKSKVPYFSYDLGVWRTGPVQKIFHNENLPSVNSYPFVDSRSPSVILPVGKLQPFAKEDVLFHYDSFWAIVPLQKKNILWSLWIQKLLEEINRSVTFFFTKNMNEDDCKSPQINVLSVMGDWKCNDRTNFFSCILELSKTMQENDLIQNSEYLTISNLLEKLLKIDYRMPLLEERATRKVSLKPVNSVLYHPAIRTKFRNPKVTFKNICPNGMPVCPLKLKEPFKTIDNILLVIVFNTVGYYQILHHLEKLYRPVFKQILYCGRRIQMFVKTYNALNYPVSFVEVHPNFYFGTLGYNCLRKAMMMNYDVEGYFHVGDDVLLNLWNLHNLPRDRLWFQKSIRVANIFQHKVPDITRWRKRNWAPWRQIRGKVRIIQVLDQLGRLRHTNKMVKGFLDQLAENAGGINRVFYEASDIYYFPRKFVKQYLFFIEKFSDNNLFLEIGIPTLMNGLVKQDEIVRLKGTYLWYQDRALYKTTFNYSHVYIHAFKVNPCMKSVPCKQFLCNKYLPCV
ncbi:hypothetical protein SNE40_017703 [Patella caerulea]|uniref:Uncharacterized protein n=1 Tax=Patella caerulea TaxID=87958 RepID=A0AAN8JFJ2_PATCE